MLWRVCLGGASLRGPLLASRVWLHPGVGTRVTLPSARQLVPQRRYSDMIPASQYDSPPSKKFQVGYVLSVYWELIPIFVVTALVMVILAFHIIWATRNKVDAVFATHSRNNISRTMNLCQPTVHKQLIINQRYEPWPEMQETIDKMNEAERRAKVDIVFTTHSRDNISRTMDPANPHCHKMFTINQRYEPWPEMAIVLEKVKNYEKRAKAREKYCVLP